MCRNIKRLRHPDRAPTDAELHDAALQFVRKISGFHAPSQANHEVFDRAVRDVAAAGRVLFQSLRVRGATAALVVALLMPIPLLLGAQASGQRTWEQIQASFEAHNGEFDYLLGDWEFTAVSKEHGRFRGFWSAIKLAEGQILDEYRVVGDTGETYYVTITLRNFNGALDRWELVGADGGSGLQDVGTGRKVGAEMHIEQTFGVAAGTPSTWRIRYYNIQPDRFSWTADRSTDGGRTWVAEFQQIEARRIGPPRSLGPLAPARRQ